MASHLGSYYALLDAVPSSYPAQDTYKAMHSVYDNTIYESTENGFNVIKKYHRSLN